MEETCYAQPWRFSKSSFPVDRFIHFYVLYCLTIARTRLINMTIFSTLTAFTIVLNILFCRTLFPLFASSMWLKEGRNAAMMAATTMRRRYECILILLFTSNAYPSKPKIDGVGSAKYNEKKKNAKYISSLQDCD